MSHVSSGGWFLALVLSMLLSLVAGLALVWLGIERTDMAFSIRQLQGQLDGKKVLKSKLEMERDRLLSPDVLGSRAEGLGMKEARPGQIRRMPGLAPETGALQ